jgi:hypothetical protein
MDASFQGQFQWKAQSVNPSDFGGRRYRHFSVIDILRGFRACDVSMEAPFLNDTIDGDV